MTGYCKENYYNNRCRAAFPLHHLWGAELQFRSGSITVTPEIFPILQSPCLLIPSQSGHELPPRHQPIAVKLKLKTIVRPHRYLSLKPRRPFRIMTHVMRPSPCAASAHACRGIPSASICAPVKMSRLTHWHRICPSGQCQRQSGFASLTTAVATAAATRF